MAKQTAQEGAIQTVQQQQVQATKPKTVLDLINSPSMQSQFAKALPSVITPERFTRIVLTALRNNPKLLECDRTSLLAAIMSAAQLGLEVNTPLQQACLVPYGKDCQFQIMYKGLIDLAYRSKEVSIIQAQTVYEKDEFIYELGLNPKLIHKPYMQGNRGAAVAYYAMYRMRDGGSNFEVMSKDDVVEFAKAKSKAFNNGPWRTDFNAMAKKTALKQVLKYAPIHSESMEVAIQNDEQSLYIDEKTGLMLASHVDVGEQPTPQEDVVVDNAAQDSTDNN